MREEAIEETACAHSVIGMHFQPRVDEWADEPAPDGALVIRRVACAEVAEVARL